MNAGRVLYGWRFVLTVAMPLLLASLGVGALTFDLIARVSTGANSEDHDRTSQIVNSALKAAQLQLANTATDNSLWDDAVRQIYSKLDEDWLAETWGVGTVDGTNYDAILIIDRSLPKPVAGFLNGEKFTPQTDQYLSGKFETLLNLLPKDAKTHGSKSTILRTSDGLAIVAAAPVLPTSNDLVIPQTVPRYIVLIRFLTPKYLKAIGQQYVIQDFEVDAIGDAKPGGDIINDVTGQPVASVQWTDRRPGDVASAAVWRKAILVLGFLALVMAGITVLCWRLIGNIGEALTAEAEARESSDLFKDLNHQVTLLNMELEAKMGQLKEAQEENVRKGKLAQLGVLIATVAHELRNPLSVVRTTTYVLQKKLIDSSIDVSSQVTRIESGIKRCDTIISQLLDFARTQKPNTIPTVVDDWLETILKEEAAKLPACLIITCNLGLQGIKVNIDVERAVRVIINLLSNASEAMTHKGHVLAEMAGRVPQIDVSTALTARGAEITVKDNGPGIPADMMTKIREPLFTTKGFGTGLGIPAVEKIMELHGGGLDINSVAGEGARFTIWFPVAQADQLAA
jgi:signal transduction histidine kinase